MFDLLQEFAVGYLRGLFRRKKMVGWNGLGRRWSRCVGSCGRDFRMLLIGILRTRIASSSMSRDGGLTAATAPTTSFSISIGGSHGSSGSGAWIRTRGSCRRAARKLARGFGVG